MRDFRLYLDDILGAIFQIRLYMRDMSKDEFIIDRKTQDAVVRNLEIIGEAAAKLPEEAIKKTTQIEWRKIKALRNILIHEYFGINHSIVWDVVQNKLAPLETACRELLETVPKTDVPADS